jgi:hypothetical protein
MLQGYLRTGGLFCGKASLGHNPRSFPKGHPRSIGQTVSRSLPRTSRPTSGEGRENAGMGVGVGDYELQGHTHLFKTHFQREANGLYRNSGKADFEDVTILSGGRRTAGTCCG